ncbi:hypothetical protein ACFYXS_15705 [Streptomyces sp. NPDC002574]|uniref:hypothetical protein n=1 Tax=Streptomyces sp. NPDC002574 TaxID=3364652 RepID=UPI0036B950ED
MGVRAAMLRSVAARPAVLLVTVPGGTGARLAAERELRQRDLPVALTPAGADILLVAGRPAPALADAVDRLWRDIAAPRARADVRDAGEVATALDTCAVRLSDPAGHLSAPGADAREARVRHGGLPMAAPGEDRDGLTLDRLHVPLGPLLADWPAGLVVRLALQGDVVQRADVDGGVAAHGPPFWSEPWLRAAAGEDVTVGAAARRRAAAHLDSLGRFLAVAGWPSQATVARRLRDGLLMGSETTRLRREVHGFSRRVGRSRTLYWLTRGPGELTQGQARDAGVEGPAARAGADVPARYRQWLADVERDLSRLDDPAPLDPSVDRGPRGRADGTRRPSAALVEVLPRMLAGAELAAARLIVASLDPDPDEYGSRPVGAVAGG